MVDPSRLQDLERFPDVWRRSLLTGVRDCEQAGLTGAVVDLLELRGWMANLGRVETDRENPLAKRQRVGEGLNRRGSAKVPQETEDEPARDAKPRLAVLQSAMDAGDHRFERHAAIGVGLGIEEDLRVAHALGGGPREIRPGQVVEILLLEEHAAAGVIDVEERLQIAENVCATNLSDRSVREPDAIAPRQLAH